MLLLDQHTGFSGGRSCGLVFPSLSEFSTFYCDSHSQRLGIVNKAEIDVFLELSCFFDDPDVVDIYNGLLLNHKKRMKSCHFQQCGWA